MHMYIITNLFEDRLSDCQRGRKTWEGGRESDGQDKGQRMERSREVEARISEISPLHGKAQVFGPLSVAFQSALAESWIGSGAAKAGTSIMGCLYHSGLTCCASILASLVLLY